MNNTTKFILFRTNFFFIFLLFTLPLNAQKEAEDYNVAPKLYTYYQQCKEFLLQPIVLSMADTLFNMAATHDDKRMQAVALSTKLDYYYYQGTQEDSIIHYTNKVKAFAKNTKQPKYYYFAWASRLITYYLKAGRTNIALYESEKMLQEAQQEVDKTGLQSCYFIMFQIYTIKGLEKMAFEWKLKEIELSEKYNLENYNMANSYVSIASYYINHNQQKKALEALEKAKKSSNSQSHKASVLLAYISYYSTFGDKKKAKQTLKECQQLFEQDKRLHSIKKNLYDAEYGYYLKNGQYKEALEAINNQEAENLRLNENIMNSNQHRRKGEILTRMGNFSEAAKFLLMHIDTEDSLKVENEQRASSEFATLLNVEKLNAEKKELTLQSQEKELHNKTTLIISLLILLGIVFFFLYRENRLNHKLKLSEAKLKEKNQELTESREELRIAKDRAEGNSQMKTTFIQSMSHEIRTPLNSIVGFSDVLGEKCCKELPETKEFVDIIKSNSNDLLRLISDVLTLSELDQHYELPANIPTNINDICYMIQDTAKANKKEGVTLSFSPEKEHLEILSNPERLSQLLITLMHNATKFTVHGNIRIAYHVMEDDKKLHITITDTGIGIPAEKQEKVFERFYKVDSFTQGTGLGLPICRNIAEKLGGSLKVDASYTEGCRMVLTIPLAHA